MRTLWEDWVDICQNKALALKFVSPSVRTIVEIGVYRGKLSQQLRLVFPEARLYLVDPWKVYPEYATEEAGPITRNSVEMETAYTKVQDLFSSDPQVSILQLSSLEASKRLPDGLDLVYIDGNHAYEYVRQDIAAWLPKVRRGGILAGDDYIPGRFPGVCQAVDERAFPHLLTFPSGVWAVRR